MRTANSCILQMLLSTLLPQPWPEDALERVANKFLEAIQFTDSERQEIVPICKCFHTSVLSLSARSVFLLKASLTYRDIRREKMMLLKAVNWTTENSKVGFLEVRNHKVVGDWVSLLLISVLKVNVYFPPALKYCI